MAGMKSNAVLGLQFESVAVYCKRCVQCFAVCGNLLQSVTTQHTDYITLHNTSVSDTTQHTCV